jgi:peptidase YpeB-like protein
MRRKTWFFPIALALVAQAAYIARAEEDDDDDEAQVGDKDLKDAKVTLEAALKTTEAQGTPISAKYELEKGKLQLSVYTMKGDKFSEVVVDHKTGKVANTEAITGGGDLKAAQEQSAAMAKAKDTLRGAVAKALAANKGFRAVSAYPKMDDGHPVAHITLVKGAESHNVTQKLD